MVVNEAGVVVADKARVVVAVQHHATPPTWSIFGCWKSLEVQQYSNNLQTSSTFEWSITICLYRQMVMTHHQARTSLAHIWLISHVDDTKHKHLVTLQNKENTVVSFQQWCLNFMSYNTKVIVQVSDT